MSYLKQFFPPPLQEECNIVARVNAYRDAAYNARIDSVREQRAVAGILKHAPDLPPEARGAAYTDAICYARLGSVLEQQAEQQLKEWESARPAQAPQP